MLRLMGMNTGRGRGTVALYSERWGPRLFPVIILPYVCRAEGLSHTLLCFSAAEVSRSNR